MRRASGVWLCGWWLASAGVAVAAPPSVPPALRDWQAWVLQGHEAMVCPLLTTAGNDNTARQCVWPGRLTLSADHAGARFRLDVQVDAESWVALPGERETWPQAVQVNARPAVVLDHAGVPSLRLAAGSYPIQGELHWQDRPTRLRVPVEIALVDLTVAGVAIGQPERDGEWLALGAAAVRQREADALSLRVYRRLADGAPPMLATRIQLHVAGNAREQLLGPVLPAAFVATQLAGDLPARLEADGRLRVQLRPGDWTLTLDARGAAALTSLAMPATAPPWPVQEIWSYADAPALRGTQATGAPAIDPAQASVPDAWRGLPALVMAPGTTLTLTARARGAGDAGERLRLNRDLWLDFDGGGLLASDHLVGDLRGTERLDVAAPWTLESASLADASQPLLVTRGATADLRGVELRVNELDLQAGLRRADPAGAQAATGGWQHALDGVEATLHLPYGYRLLGAPGADRSPDSWVARWNLLDLFVVAVVALLAWRGLRWPWALAALAYAVLAHGEHGAPLGWPALALALCLAARALPQGRLQSFARYGGLGAWALAVLLTLPFAAHQLRSAMHPQLEHRGDSLFAMQNKQAASTSPPPPPAPMMEATPAAPSAKAMSVTADLAMRSAPPTLGKTPDYPAGAQLQSGPGVPDWGARGSAYRLGWSGPVTVQQTWRAIILPAWATRGLRVLMLALLLAWLAAIARAFKLGPGLPRRPARHVASLAALVLAAACMRPAHAQTMPPPELLQALQTRLLAAPQCAPECAASPQARVAITSDGLQAGITVGAEVPVAFPLPSMDAPAVLRQVRVDGRAATRLAGRDGQLWVALERGVHQVTLDFSFNHNAASVALRFPLPPPNAEVTARGWQVSGVDGPRLLADAVVFTRERAAATSAAAATVAAQAFPPYVALTRSLTVGLDARVVNTVTRIAPAQGGFSVELPLLPGEHVTDAGMPVQAGRVRVTFMPEQPTAGWSSALDVGDSLRLVAPDLAVRAEVWQVSSSPALHLEFSGLPASLADAETRVAGGQLFRPLPGEALTVAISQPLAVAGHTVAFDRVTLDVARGEHALESSLNLTTRSTRGGEQFIAVPRGSALLDASRDGEMLNLALHDNQLALPVLPGTQSFELHLRDASPLGVLTRTPAIALNAPAANLYTTLKLPDDRWVLWVWGPQAGPAVLYWAQLVVLLLAAIALARFAPTPLRGWHWVLLGLGFSTFAWSAWVLVVLWLIALGWRARSAQVTAWQRGRFNLMQVALAVFTLIALAILIASIPHGLLGQPDMRVAGGASRAWALRWFADQTTSVLPQAGAFSLPLWVYKAAMLIWALWLANALIGWLRWGFQGWMRGGYWKPKADAVQAPPPPAATP